METLSINLTKNSSDIRTHFYPPIQLKPDKRHEMALIRLETYNSIPNVDDTNNVFRYEVDSKTYDIIIPTGAYELSQINDVIQNKLIKKNDIELLANNTTLKCIIRINNPTAKVYFNHARSLRDMLGYTCDSITDVGDHEGSNVVQILRVNSVLVNCDVITGSYVNSSQKPVLYSFFPNVPPGYKVIESPGTPVYLPVSQNYIESIRLWLTDQDKRDIDLRGETLSVWLIIRSHD